MRGLKKPTMLTVAGLAVALAFSAPVRAEDAGASLFGNDSSVASEDLASVRGMQNTFDGELTATLSDNNVYGDSGERKNVIDVTAFQGASGVATVIQNAGDNVIIQTITMVTVNYN